MGNWEDKSGEACTEDKLRASEARYRALYEANPLMVFTVTPDGAITSANPMAAEQLGYSVEELQQCSMLDLFLEGDRATVLQQIAICSKDAGQVKHCDIRLLRKEGDPLWVKETARAFEEADGTATLMIVCEDITEQRQAEAALRKSEEWFSRTFNTSPVPMVVRRLRDARYMDVNETFLRGSGYLRQEIVGKTDDDINLWVDIGKRAQARMELKERGRVTNLEASVRRKDGTIRIGLFSAEVINLDGEECALIAMNDITERKQVEEALRTTEERFSKAFRAGASPASITSLDEGRYLDVNQSFLQATGYTRDEVLGRTSTELGIWEDPTLRKAILETLKSGGPVRDVELNYRTKSGEEGVWLLSAELIDIGGERFIIATRNDITKRKRAEENLQASEERFSKAFHGSPVPMSISRNELFIDVNDSFLRTSGFTRDEVVGHTAGELDLWVDRAEQELVAATVRESRGVRNMECKYRMKDGQVRTFLISIDVIEIAGTRSVLAVTADITDRKRAEEALQSLVAGTASVTGQAFFPEVVRHVAGALGVRYVMMTEITAESPLKLRTLAFWLANHWRENFEYFAENTPCEQVIISGEMCYYPINLQEQFSEDPGLRDLGAVSYLGTPLFSSSGKMLGHLCVMDNKTINDDPRTRSIVTVFAARAAAELERKRAEDALRESEARSRRLIDSNIIGVVIADLTGSVIVANDAFLRMVGYDQEDVAARRVNRALLTPPEYQTLDQMAVADLKASGTCAPYVKEYIRRDGTRVPVMLGVAMLEGTGDKAIAFVLDLTEQRRAQKALVESERRFRALIENSSDAIALLNSKYKLFYASPSASRIAGYPAEELMGQNFLDRIHPDDLEGVKADLARLAEQPGQVTTNLFRSRHRDGSWRWIETISTNLLTEPSVGALVVNYRDVSERRRAEEEQAQLQAVAQNVAREWRLTFDAVEFPILLLELDGTVARLNRAAMLLAGRDYREIKGCAVGSIGPGEPWRQIAELVPSVRANRTSVFEQTQDPATGKNWEITGSLFSGSESGDEEKVIVLARDVSQMVQLQESLRRSETMSAMGQLVAGVAHEVRNPLFGISATLDAFSARFGEPEEYRQYTTILRREVGRLSALMRELLEYGKPLNQELAPGSLQPVIIQAVLDCKLQADRAGVSIINNLGNLQLPVLMDRGRLLQVFRNLIENAIQHSPSGAAISVDARRMKEGSDSWVECAIADSGTGFQPEDLPRVFDPFFTKRRGGTGLGLSIVQRIVEEHKGSIRLGNRNGSGALVKVRLPLFNGTNGNP